jgi:replicative DNA helicase
MSIAEIAESELSGVFAQPQLSDALIRQAPHNVEVEQSLLGAILVNNSALHHLDDRLQPEHFYEPLHQQIFKAILHFNDRGNIANHITLKHYFALENTQIENEYLAKLAISAVTVINIKDYSSILFDLHLKRQLIAVGETMVNEAYQAKIDSPAINQLEKVEQQLFRLSETGDAGKNFLPFRVFGSNAVAMAEKAHKRKGEVVGVSTGLVDLDKLLGGLQNSDLIILAGRPSMGKTALATTIAYQAAKRFHLEAQNSSDDLVKNMPLSVGFFSLEMSSEQLATRVLAAEANINSSSIMRGDLDDTQFASLIKANMDLSTIPFFVDDTPALSISALRTRARRLKRVSNLGLVVVDYLQLVTISNRGSQMNRVQEVSEITQGLKALAKELNVPVIALSQLSRAVESREDKRPQLSDLRESGSIEQDADVVMFVYREQYYLERIKPEDGTEKMKKWQEDMERAFGKADAIIAKQRHGAIGTVTLQFDGDKARFRDYQDAAYLPERIEHYTSNQKQLPQYTSTSVTNVDVSTQVKVPKDF